MPLFEIGYRRYVGERTHERLRWWPIARHGWTLALRAKLLRRLILITYLPLVYFIPLFFVIGKITDPELELPSGIPAELARGLLGTDLIERLHANPTSLRTAVWSVIFTVLVAWLQLIPAALVAAIVGPPLISQDLRSRAFLLYFSRPISSVDYLLGKAVALGGLVAAVTLLPSLLLYVISIAFSPSWDTVVHTVPVLLDIVLASAAIVVPFTLILLTLSSLTKQTRFAAITWAVICGFGVLFHQVIRSTHDLRDAVGARMFSVLESVRAAQLSVFDVHGRLEAIPGAPLVPRELREITAVHGGGQAIAFLTVISVVCWLFLLRRVSAPTRI